MQDIEYESRQGRKEFSDVFSLSHTTDDTTMVIAHDFESKHRYS